MVLRSKSDKETQQTAHKLGSKLRNGAKKGILCLYGDLGAGKTTFVRGLASGLGIKSRVASPTYTYQRVHKGDVNLYHFDCYRTATAATAATESEALLLLSVNDIQEALDRKDGIVVIEWAQNIQKFLPEDRIDIYLKYIDENTREIKIETNSL